MVREAFLHHQLVTPFRPHEILKLATMVSWQEWEELLLGFLGPIALCRGIARDGHR